MNKTKLKNNGHDNEMKAFELTVQISKLADQAFISTSQLTEIITGLCSGDANFDMRGDDRQVSIFAITQLMEFLRRLPIKFFREVDNRMHILEAMQAQLDELIIIEEQEENEDVSNEVVDEEDAQCSVENVIKNA